MTPNQIAKEEREALVAAETGDQIAKEERAFKIITIIYKMNIPNLEKVIHFVLISVQMVLQ